MPEYIISHNGGFENEELRIPPTFNHMNQTLYHFKPKNWKYLQDAAAKILSGKIKITHKIKPSSLRQIRDNSAFACILPHLTEHLEHNDPSSETHKGGGIQHAIETILQIVGGLLGGKVVNQFFSGVKEHGDLTQHEINLAKLIQGTYQDKRPENIGNFTRIDDYDTNYGSVWKDSSGKYVLTVRGTRLKFKDILKDIKIAWGSTSVKDDELTDMFRHFKHDHPGVGLEIASHSLGSILTSNSLKEVQFENKPTVHFFNPSSSPFQKESAIREVIENKNYNSQFYLNTSDIVSNYFGQNMTQEEIHSKVKYGKFSRSPLASHGLQQWVSSSAVEDI